MFSCWKNSYSKFKDTEPINCIENKTLKIFNESNGKKVCLQIENGQLYVVKYNINPTKIHHEYIMNKMIKSDIFIKKAGDCIFFKYLPMGDGIDFINNLSDLEYTKKLYIILNYILDIVEQLLELHNINYHHGDIKLDNILYDYKKDKFYLCDFESTQCCKNAIPYVKGTQYYVDPYLYKYVKNQFIDKPNLIMSDIYSLGITCWCLLYTCYPFDEFNYNSPYNELPPYAIRDTFNFLIIKMIKKDQKKRPDLKYIHSTIKMIISQFVYRYTRVDKFSYLDLHI